MREINTMSTRVLILFSATFWLAACTNYQYVHLTSDLPKTADTEHYYLSDSLVYIDFDFNGNQLPVKIYFLNESQIPVYFDLTETLFFENGSLIQSAYGLAKGALDEKILIPAGKGAAFQFRPYMSSRTPFLKKKSKHVEISNGIRKESATGAKMEEQGRRFEIFISYITGDEKEITTSLSAKFKEDYVYFTTSKPEFFPSGSSPYCYYIEDENEGGQIAATILFEVASASLYYLMLEGLD